jgi:hypothetical protein
VSLEPIRKLKTKPSKQAVLNDLERLSMRQGSQPALSIIKLPDGETSSLDEPPHSPAPSTLSHESGISGSSISFRVGNGVARSNLGNESNITSIRDQTIKATAELLRGGCLPGDIIPVKITIDHVKPMKSMQGIIVTLYRIGRMDTHPNISSFKGKGISQDEFYPKSRTGLGGLSLSSAGSSHTFRMDLAQTFAPLIIDPHTLSACVKSSVQMPDDVVQTYLNVPGGMISFRYVLEVIIDLRGKLGAQDRFLPRMTMTGAQTQFGYQQGSSYSSSNGGITHFADTSQIRREKSVVHCTFDLVVGTKDSTRKATRRALDPWDDPITTTPHDAKQGTSLFETSNRTRPPPQRSFSANILAPRHRSETNDHLQASSQIIEETSTQQCSPPHRHQNHDSEKEQLRQAELRLLPSAPPMEGSPSSSSGPTAPTLDDLDEAHYHTSAPAYSPPHPLPSAGPSTAIGLSETLSLARHDDKQELERERLLAAASSPAALYDEAQEDHTLTLPSVPTAPLVDEEAEYEAAGLSSTTHNEDLPQYAS